MVVQLEYDINGKVNLRCRVKPVQFTLVCEISNASITDSVTWKSATKPSSCTYSSNKWQ